MSNLIYYVLIGVSVLLNGSGGMLMKVGAKNVPFGEGGALIDTIKSMIVNWQLIIGVFLYGMSFVVSTLIYTKIPLNIAYPVIMGGTLIFVAIGTIIFLGEKFTTWHLFGMLFLLIGIGMIAKNLKS